MKDQEVFNLKLESMGQHEAVISYNGTLTQEGVLVLTGRLERLFGYYQYERVVLKLESPGGDVNALDYLLRILGKYAKSGHWVETQSTFMCASAGAVLLSAGSFGTRRVGPQTMLLYHCARLQSEKSEFTASSSVLLTQALLNIDRKLIDSLVARFIDACGAELGFVQVLTQRLKYVQGHWDQLAPQLVTITSGDAARIAPDWLKPIKQVLNLQDNAGQCIASYKRYLIARFQKEQRMHALEAYVLCFIDAIEGVITHDDIAQNPTYPTPTVADPAIVNSSEHQGRSPRLSVAAG